jgi:CelD/BcsL family acetyltransferase involved in cellulose biosynthesis
MAFRNVTVPASVTGIALPRHAEYRCELPPDLRVCIYTGMESVECLWRSFEQTADCTAFQTFDWLAAWHRNIGRREQTLPAIVVGSDADGQIVFILPLAVESKRSVRRLCWLGQDLCDYNAPLLAPDFSQRISPDRFVTLWRSLQQHLQSEPALRHDWIELEKMPQTVGGQINPFTSLAVTPNPNSAHLTQLTGDWKTFYFEKRSSATRRHDRAKHKHMAEFGKVRFQNAIAHDEQRRTLETLMDQKSRAFARQGIADMFARPGCREFFLELISSPTARNLVHLSRIDIGSDCAATNFGIVFGDCYYHVLASYDQDIAASRYGPGALHLRELMAHAIERGLRRFDFTIGDERYKLEWCDVHVPLFDYTVATTGRGWPARCASAVRRRLKRFIKHSPLAWSLVGRLRSAVGSLAPPQRP